MAFVLGIILSVPFMVGLFVLGLILEHKDQTGWALVMLIATGVIAYTIFSIPTLYLLWGAGIYALAGVVWSFWRWRRHCSAIVLRLETDRYFTKNEALSYIDVSNQKGRIAQWILAWPVSFIALSLHDIIVVTEEVVVKFFHRVYSSLSADAKGKIEESTKQD